MKIFRFHILFFILILLSDNGNTTSQKKIDSTNFIKINFFYDANLNGVLDKGEDYIRNLEITSDPDLMRDNEGALIAPQNQLITMQVSGMSPGGKKLTNITLFEPFEVIMLPGFSIQTKTKNILIGLADGYLTSPLNPKDMNMTDYNNVKNNPQKWITDSNPYYPEGWMYKRNYFFYGYRIPEGGLKGTPHLAFDIWANPGKKVLASVPGIIVKPLFDWRFGISGSYGTVYYNHIVPSVRIGDKVKRYDVVGYIAEGQGNHVHFELRPDEKAILTAFPGAREHFFLKSPSNGESVPLPPYFGQK